MKKKGNGYLKKGQEFRQKKNGQCSVTLRLGEVCNELIVTADEMTHLDSIHKELLLKKYKIESKEIVKSFIKKLFH